MLALPVSSVLREALESGRDRPSCSPPIVLHLNEAELRRHQALASALAFSQSIKLSSRVTHRVRFRRPYIYTMEAPGLAGQQLTVQQRPFSHEGFASTGASSQLRL